VREVAVSAISSIADLPREVIGHMEEVPLSSRGCRLGGAYPGGRRHLPRSSSSLAWGPARPPDPGSAQGHVGHRTVPQRGAGLPRPAPSRVRCQPDLLQLLP